MTELGGVSGRTLWLAPASGNVAAAEVGLRKASEVCGGSIPAPHADWRIMEGPRTGVLTSWRVFGQAADQNARQRPKTSKGGSLLDLLPAAWVLVIWLSDGSCTLGETWAVWSAKKRAQRVGPDGTRQDQVGTLPAPPRAALPAPHAPAHARLLLLLLRSRRPESVAIAPKYKTGACGAACAELALCAVLTQVLCCLVGFDIAPNHPHAPLARIAAAPPGRQPGHAPPVPASANTLALHNHEQAHVLLSRSYPLGWVMCAKGQKGYGQTPHRLPWGCITLMPGVPGRFRPRALSDLWPRGPLAAVRSGSLSAHGLQSQRKMRSEMAKPKAVCRLPSAVCPSKAQRNREVLAEASRPIGVCPGRGVAVDQRADPGTQMAMPWASLISPRSRPGPRAETRPARLLGLCYPPSPEPTRYLDWVSCWGQQPWPRFRGTASGGTWIQPFAARPASSAPTAASIRITITVIFTAGFYIVESRLWRRLQILMVSSHGGPTAESYEP